MKPNRSQSYKNSNTKHQITNKSQIPIFNDQNIWNLGHCDLPFDLAQGGEVVSPSTLLRTVSLSNGLSNHLVFVFCYLKFLIAETLGFFATCCQNRAHEGLISNNVKRLHTS